MSDEESYWLAGSSDDDNNPFADSNRIVPTKGQVRCELMEAKSPQFAEARWFWEIPASHRQDGPYNVVTSWEPLIPAPQMTLRFELTNAPTTDDWPTTIVKVIHDQVPAEFVADLTAYWLWKLEDGDYVFDLGDQRKKKARAVQQSSTRVPDEVQ